MPSTWRRTICETTIVARRDETPPPRWHLWGFWCLVALAYGLVFGGLWALWLLLAGGAVSLTGS